MVDGTEIEVAQRVWGQIEGLELATQRGGADSQATAMAAKERGVIIVSPKKRPEDALPLADTV